MKQAFSKIWIIVIILVLIVGGFFAWHYFGTTKEEVKVRNVIQEFYGVLENQNGELLMNYFTSPETSVERDSYNWLTGADLPEESRFYRIFLRVKISNPSIEEVKKIEEGKFQVNVKDELQSYSNVTAEWGSPNTRNIRFVIVRTGDKWLVDKYIWEDPAKIYRTEKYSGFGQEEIVTDLTNWKTYSNPEVNFTFKYPSDWEIKEEYEYKSAACQMDPECKGVQYIFLNKINDTRPAQMKEKEKFGIVINMSQCTGVKWDDVLGGNWICLFDENPEALIVYEQIKKSFKLVESETADWNIYRSEEYGFEMKYPLNWFIEDDGYIDYLNGIRITFCKENINNECPSRGTAPNMNIYLFKFKKDNTQKELYSFVFEATEKAPRDYWPWGSNPQNRCEIIFKTINEKIIKMWNCSTSLHAFWEKDKNDSDFYNMNVYSLDVFPETSLIFNQMLSTLITE